MDDISDSPRPQPRIDAAAKAVFLAALRKGAPREDAAARAGFSLTGFYGPAPPRFTILGGLVVRPRNQTSRRPPRQSL